MVRRGFNPTLVRLALVSRLVRRHEGVRFNPTLVRLAPIRVGDGAPLERGFNPTLVRLAPKWVLVPLQAIVRFQSHPGSISTRLWARVRRC